MYYDSSEVEAFRFIIIRSFQGSYLLRVENENDQVSLHFKEIIQGYPGEFDSLASEEIVMLPTEYWQELVSTFSEMNFWTIEKSRIQIIPMEDGNSIIVEGWWNGNHQVTRGYYLDQESYRKVSAIVNHLTDLTTISQSY